MVSIHPPLCRRGEQREVIRDRIALTFQSTPRFVGEGNGSASSAAGRPSGFNPPPALSARGTRSARSARLAQQVSIHPPLCRRGELPTARGQRAGGQVSIHPPLCRRGEPPGGIPPLPENPVSIHPPLCRRGELATADVAVSDPRFQSTPRFVGEGNTILVFNMPVANGFNPPPALSARGTWVSVPHASADEVSIHPPLCRRGEHDRIDLFGELVRVSIHPPLCRRGERDLVRTIVATLLFQSTPRFVGEGNQARRAPAGA